MRIAIVAMMFAVSAIAQIPANPRTACGPETVSFKVNIDKSQHASAPPDPGKARVYFIHDAGTNQSVGYPTVKVAMDGAWLGANHGNSYFSVSVAPGEHHLCVAMQSTWFPERVELIHFTAAAETVYYYRTRLVLSRNVDLLELNPIDSDEGRNLIALFPFSVSSPKK